MNQYILLIYCIILLVGCASPGVSPKEANFFQALGNIFSGEFDRQTKQKQQQLDSTDHSLAVERGHKYLMTGRIATEAREIDALATQLKTMKEKNLQLEGVIFNLEEDTKEKKELKQKYTRELNKLKNDLAKLETQKIENEQDYRKQVITLEKRIKILEHGI